MAGELSFPSAEECDSAVAPTRHVTVPVTFDSVAQYRQVFKAALRGRCFSSTRSAVRNSSCYSYQRFLHINEANWSFPLYKLISLVCIQLYAKEVLPAGKSLRMCSPPVNNTKNWK